MRKAKQHKSKAKTDKVTVGSPSQQEVELKPSEARKIRGGGGCGGGVLRTPGEEIPQRS